MPDKKYSRLVRKLAQTLIAWNVPMYFRHPYINPETQNEEWKQENLVDIIEHVLEGETIKRSELDDLRKTLEAQKNYIQDLEKDRSDLFHACIGQPPDTIYSATSAALSETLKSLEAWKVRTWTAEQEIHDLKEQAERNYQADDRIIERIQADNRFLIAEANAYLFANARQFEEIRKLQETNTINVENYAQLKKKYDDLVAEVNKPAEELNPPACLKPKDAISWSAETYYSTPAPISEKWTPLETNQFTTGLNQAKKSGFVKKYFSRIAISLLLLTVLGLGFVTYRQGQTIELQRHVLRDAYEYIISNCPPVTNQPSALSEAHR